MAEDELDTVHRSKAVAVFDASLQQDKRGETSPFSLKQ